MKNSASSFTLKLLSKDRDETAEKLLHLNRDLQGTKPTVKNLTEISLLKVQVSALQTYYDALVAYINILEDKSGEVK